MSRISLIFIIFLTPIFGNAQNGKIEGLVKANGLSLPYANILIVGTSHGAVSDSLGFFSIDQLDAGRYYDLKVSMIGYQSSTSQVMADSNLALGKYIFELHGESTNLSEVVVTGSKRPVSRMDSPVPVEVYTAKFFKANPSPSVFEAIQNVNGVRPQVNCNVCNTGDIHINGLEGPYTMVLIDGMPIVSGLASVYGLTGIPQSLVDRIEVVKGPASTLYGSEAVGGIINVITKDPLTAAPLSLDIYGSSWAERNVDAGLTIRSKVAQSLIGVNYFNYQRPIDNNLDGFTDVTLQHRISVFNKWNFNRKNDRVLSIAGRIMYEDRWGGEMDWNSADRGGDEVYGESVYTKRWELFGRYQLPSSEQIMLEFSANGHDQNSAYGNTFFLAKQKVGFGQLTWHKEIGLRHSMLFGAAYRYTDYNDNTGATEDLQGRDKASQIHLPGLFLQDEIQVSSQLKLLVGMRFDVNSIHGDIFSPRFNLKWSNAEGNTVMRLSGGNGYRVANIFTEDHAALSGARNIVFKDHLLPEKSYNLNLNYVRKYYLDNGTFLSVDATAFYTYFTNRIVPDYTTNQNYIFYDNLRGFAVSNGVSANVDLSFPMGLQGRIGATLMDVRITQDDQTFRQLLTERFSTTWGLNYAVRPLRSSIDFTGNLYSPMRLPLLGDLDTRPSRSPWYSIQNVQVTRKFEAWEIYGGVKNLLNFTPPANSIARSFDPFDRKVLFDSDGSVIPTNDNPQALTFDPSYVFAANQGRRWFVGFRYSLY